MSNSILFRNVGLYDANHNLKTGNYVLVEDGYIKYIGKSYSGNVETKINGGVISRPFCDYHFHFPGSFLYDKYGVNLTCCSSPDEYKDYLLKKSEGMPLVRGFGWELVQLKDYLGGTSFISFLDEIFPSRPVLLFSADFHMCWCNTEGLNLLNKELPDYNSLIIYDGMIYEQHIADRIFNSPGLAFKTKHLKEAALMLQKQLFSKGITSIYTLMSIGTTDDFMLSVLKKMDIEGKLKLKVNYACTIYPEQSNEEITFEVDNARQYCSSHLQLSGIKVYMDGVIDDHSAFLLYNYSDVDYRGKCLWEKKHFEEIIEIARNEKLPLHIHAIGDAAVKFAVDCLNNKKHDYKKIGRHIITHIQLCDKETIRNMAKNNIIACMQPFWFYRGSQALKIDQIRLGDRVKNEYPVRSLMDDDVKVVFSSDCPANISFDPIEGIKIAVSSDDSERINNKEAYLAYCDGTYLEKQFNLTVGDSANFIVFNSDILTNTKSHVIATYIDGKAAFESEEYLLYKE